MTAPFLDATAFADMFRPLRAAETAVATPLLQVVSDWIRDKKPDIANNDQAAIFVCFDIARQELTYGKYSQLSDFSETVGRKNVSGTLNITEAEQFITDRHRKILGLSIVAAPAFNFPECDY